MTVDCGCTNEDDLVKLVNESIDRISKAPEGDNLAQTFSCQKIRVAKVHLDGLNKTKKTHFNGRSIFDGILKADSVQSLAEESLTLREKLKSIGVFKDVALTVDASSVQPLLPEVKCVDLVLDCKETRMLKASVNVMAGSNEFSGQTVLKLANVFGRGEGLSFGHSRSTANIGCYSFDITKFLSHDFNTAFKWSFLKSHEPSYISNYDLKNCGFLAEVSRPHNKWRSTLRYGGIWRNFYCPSWETPFDIRLNSGHSLISSLLYTLAYNSRQGAAGTSISPGMSLESKIELAGMVLGGEHNFLKVETKFKKIASLTSWARLSLSLNAGHLVSLDTTDPPSIVDRFFLGGPGSVRGFMMGGLGPHRNNCAFGGASYWSSGISLFTRLPFRPAKGSFGDQFWLHAFVNAGNLFEKIDVTEPDFVQKLCGNMRYTVGAGIHWRFMNFASIELNYCIPKSVQPGDRANPGVQLGVSLDVL